MNESEQRDIFEKNFRYYVDQSGKTQKEIAKDLGYSYTTVNTWYRGAALPNAAKIQTIADYFNINKSQLLDNQDDEQEEDYYLDPETARVAQELRDDPNLRILFDAARDASPEALRSAAEIIRVLKKQYGKED